MYSNFGITTTVTTRLRWSAVIVFLVTRASLVTSCVRASCQVYAGSSTLPTGMPRYRANLVLCTCNGGGKSSK
ncbi:hypothetical protein PF004_g14006 [Phytophthora fragariae]|uniref:Uncharacterized protein n=1 Tax=Phytophthora fragariae TaxID=53985 RepID=A0A6G0RK82_9STRA|nr:hypothetical protein PF004_g14006 [Phytophthora fragariae]KAE9334713.1 hypothetical protein PF008_g13828 [Phytophthora fragariae]